MLQHNVSTIFKIQKTREKGCCSHFHQRTTAMAYYLPTITSASTPKTQSPTFAEQSDQFFLINATNTITSELSSGVAFYARRPSDWQLPLDYQVVSSGAHADWEAQTFTGLYLRYSSSEQSSNETVAENEYFRAVHTLTRNSQFNSVASIVVSGS